MSWIALAGLGVSFYFEIYWVMGLVYLGWAVDALRHRTAYLIEEIPRSRHPITYWVIVLMWIGLGIWTLAFSPGPSYPWQTNQANHAPRPGAMGPVYAEDSTTQWETPHFSASCKTKPG